MDFIKATTKLLNGSITWNPLPYHLQAASFISIVSITDEYISDIDVSTPGADPYFLFECLDFDGQTFYLVTNGTNYHCAKSRHNNSYRVAKTGVQLTTNDQDFLIPLIRSVCDNAIRD